MPISLRKLGTAGLIGLGDIATEYVDETYALKGKPWQNATDWQRTIGFGLGLGLSYMAPRWGDIGEAMAIAEIPLLEKSLRDGILSLMAPAPRIAPRGQLVLRHRGVMPQTVTGVAEQPSLF